MSKFIDAAFVIFLAVITIASLYLFAGLTGIMTPDTASAAAPAVAVPATTATFNPDEFLSSEERQWNTAHCSTSPTGEYSCIGDPITVATR